MKGVKVLECVGVLLSWSIGAPNTYIFFQKNIFQKYC